MAESLDRFRTFVYLVQVEYCENALEWNKKLKAPHRDIFILAWARNYTAINENPCPENESDGRFFHFPNSTWNSGRNELYRRAQASEQSAN